MPVKTSFHVLGYFFDGQLCVCTSTDSEFFIPLLFFTGTCVFFQGYAVRSFMSPQRKYDFQSKAANVSNSSTYGYFHGNSQELFFTGSFFVFTRLNFFPRGRKNAGFNCSDLGKSVTSAQVYVLRFAQISISAQI